jgi:hypothetical protein
MEVKLHAFFSFTIRSITAGGNPPPQYKAGWGPEHKHDTVKAYGRSGSKISTIVKPLHYSETIGGTRI